MEELIKVLEAESCPEAWLLAVKHLLGCKDHNRFNLSLGVKKPKLMSEQDFHIFDTVDEFLRGQKTPEVKPLSTVAGTIFPANYYEREGAKGVFESFPNDYLELGPHGGWGIYAMRLIQMETKKGFINPLKELIEKIIRLKARNHLAYEINIVDNILYDIPLYRTENDRNRHMRQPCLSHLTFKLYPNNQLSLVALYRSHFYITKALGNLIGLAQLQAFVASEVGMKPGPLICHSTHARIDTGKTFGMNDIRKLVEKCSV